MFIVPRNDVLNRADVIGEEGLQLSARKRRQLESLYRVSKSILVSTFLTAQSTNRWPILQINIPALTLNAAAINVTAHPIRNATKRYRSAGLFKRFLSLFCSCDGDFSFPVLLPSCGTCLKSKTEGWPSPDLLRMMVFQRRSRKYCGEEIVWLAVCIDLWWLRGAYVDHVPVK